MAMFLEFSKSFFNKVSEGQDNTRQVGTRNQGKEKGGGTIPRGKILETVCARESGYLNGRSLRALARTEHKSKLNLF